MPSRVSAQSKRKSKALVSDADGASDSDVSLSDPSQRFEPHEDDEEQLWTVIEIIGEDEKRYKVRWDGDDPKTGKPWTPSWTFKKDVTDDLVLKWRKKKKEKERKKLEARAKRKSKAGRVSTSTASRARSSMASTSTSRNTRSHSNSVAASSATATVKREQSVASSSNFTTRPPPKSTRTSTLSRTTSSKSKGAFSVPPKTKNARAHESDEDELDLSEEEEAPTITKRLSHSTKHVESASRQPPKTKKRKLSETDFHSADRSNGTRTSRPVAFSPGSVSNDDEDIIPAARTAASRSSTSEQEDQLVDDERVDKIERFVDVFTSTRNGHESGSGRATKRRRILERRRDDEDEDDEIDEINEDDDQEQERPKVKVEGEPDTQESFEPRKGGSGMLFLASPKNSTENDEEEARLIEETLSQASGSSEPGPRRVEGTLKSREKERSGTPQRNDFDPEAYLSINDFDMDPGHIPDVFANEPMPDVSSDSSDRVVRSILSSPLRVSSKPTPKAKATLKPKPKFSKQQSAQSSDSDVEIISIHRIEPKPKVNARTGDLNSTSTSPPKVSTSKKLPHPSQPVQRTKSTSLRRTNSSASSSATIQVKIGPPGKRRIGLIPASQSGGSEDEGSEEYGEGEPRPHVERQVAKRTSRPLGTKEVEASSSQKAKTSEKVTTSDSKSDATRNRTNSIKKPTIFPSAKPPTGIAPSRIGDFEFEDGSSTSKPRPAAKPKPKTTIAPQEEEKDSDTDREPPPLEWEIGSPTTKRSSLQNEQREALEFSGSVKQKQPIREISVVYDGDGMDVYEEPAPAVAEKARPDPAPLDPAEMTEEVLKERLSPTARKRLRKFEAEIMREGRVEGDGDDRAAKRTKKERKKAKMIAAAAAAAEALEQPLQVLPYPNPTKTHQPQHSYITDIVPETEVEESQSQEKELKIPPPPQLAPPPPPPERAKFNLAVPTTPKKPSLKSKMKPRTPGPNNASMTDVIFGKGGVHVPDVLQGSPANGTKPTKLRPIPQISPSKFHPHIQAFPSSSLEDSIIEPASSNESRQKGTQDGVESIEEFDSPEKRRTGNNSVGVLLSRHDREPGDTQSADDVWQSEIVQRGRRIAEEAEKRRRREASSSSRGEEEEDEEGGRRQKKSLRDVNERARARSEGMSSVGYEHQDVVASQDKAQGGGSSQETQEDGVADASTTVIPPASGPPALTPVLPPSQVSPQLETFSQSLSQPEEDNVSSSIQEMDSVPIDLPDTTDIDQPPIVYPSPPPPQEQRDGEMDETRVSVPDELEVQVPAPLRQEEEESTQDLMAELRALKEEREVGVEAGWDPGPQSGQDVEIHIHPPDQEDVGSEKESDTGDYLDIPQITIVQPSPAPSVRSQSVLSDVEPEGVLPKRPMTRSRSRSQTPTSIASPSSKRGQGRGKARAKKPLEIPSPIQSRSGTPEQDEQAPAQVVDPPAAGPSSSVFTPILTSQITSLETQLADERQKSDGLQQELHSMREQLKQIAEQSSNLDSTNRQEIATLQIQWASERTAWEDERIALQTRVTSLQRAKELANQDCDVFREQYAKASGFVTGVREENRELEKRVQIAEGQTRAGVELIKATFELRVKSLEEDVKAWRNMAEFVIEKDRRTNDDIRRRAAEEPELRARCERQRHAIELDEERIEDLEADLMEKQGHLDRAKAEIGHWKRENIDLQTKLNGANTKLDRLGGKVDETSQGDGHEFVYRCQWRGFTEEPCREVCLTERELEDHAVSHLYPQGDS